MERTYTRLNYEAAQNTSSDTPPQGRTYDVSLTHISTRITNIPSEFFVSNGEMFETGIRAFHGILISCSTIDNYVYVIQKYCFLTISKLNTSSII